MKGGGSEWKRWEGGRKREKLNDEGSRIIRVGAGKD